MEAYTKSMVESPVCVFVFMNMYVYKTYINK